MKKLILVRHGKSSWEHNLPDNERPLLKRGYTDGELVSKAFTKSLDIAPVIWTSPAIRALETAKIFRNNLNIVEDKFNIKQGLYTFNWQELLHIINSCEPEVENLMIFGHNPAMTNLVNILGDKHFDNIPTTGLTYINFESATWENLKQGTTLLNLFPKNLR
ncbi:histidine phosphatase family protein [Gillisia sp. M10.2A]|uniref:Histidine phosphatase family protein n=1 Tax=Gillisia lutea TaxID=2909668 RepID=A0ABS9EEZ0_9FLAO|nr:histidine phosphatase family protein [Gillisia lutea]MCF4101440.1 histidine phosphatase family protein [Gillisia lutea]